MMFFKVLFVCLIAWPFSTLHAANEVNLGPHYFSFHGYSRMSLATSKEGSTQAYFKAPGASSKYRLGNESENLIRLQLHHRYQENAFSDPHINTVVAMQATESQGSDNALGFNCIPIAYSQFKNFTGNNISFWLGRRRYGIKAVSINDHWWLNGGNGAHIGTGIEDISISTGQLNIALFRHEDKGVNGLAALAANSGTLNSSSLDIRLQELSINESSTLNLWALYIMRHKQDQLGFSKKTGFGFGAWIDNALWDGENILVATYRKGPAIRISPFNSRPIREDLAYDLDSASMWEINNSWTFDDQDKFAIQWVLIARQDDYGQIGIDGSKVSWYSAGMRPVFYTSQYTSIATELGFDQVDNKVLGVEGLLTKATIALQLSTDKKFNQTPKLKLFLTLANWDKSFTGLIGNSPNGAPYGNNTFGWTLGVQLEHAW